jgi:DNA polymerase III alpha subunit (gram-positive type)
MTIFILDFETNGLNPWHDDVIEIAIKVYGEDISYDSLVIPQNKKGISDKITEITGITNQKVKEEGKKHRVAYQEFIDFIKYNSSQGEPFYLIAHNGQGFDFLFFKKILSEMNETMDNVRYIDSIFYSKSIHPKMYSHSMKTLCKIYNIENVNAHRAMSDVNALEELCNIMIDKGGLSDPKEMWAKVEFV